MKKSQKIKNEFLLKRGAYNIVLIAVVVAAVIAVNALSIMIASRFPTDLDLTTTGENSISGENAEYIEGVEREVEIIVCATREGFVSQTMQDSALKKYYVYFQDPGYLEQAQKLIDTYAKYNGKIDITYADPDAASFGKIVEKAGGKELNYGDILVYSSFKTEAGEVRKNARILTVKDMFETTEYSMDYSGNTIYTVASSDVETAVTSAIYTVTSDEVKTVAVLSGKSTEGSFDAISPSIALNAYNVINIDSAIITEIPKEVDILVISAPKKDFSASEIEVLEKFLDNGGNRNKDIMVFLSAANINMPNLYAFLAEWGADVSDGEIIFESNDKNWISTSSPAAIFVANLRTDYTASMNEQSYYYVVDNMVPMKQSYVTQGNRVSNVLMSTYDSAFPIAIDAEEIDDMIGDSYAVCIYTHDTLWDNDFGAKKSGVLVCASVDFVLSDWISQSVVGNDEFLIAALNNISGRDISEIAFTQKVVEDVTFLAPSNANVKVMRIIFVYMLPFLVLAGGIFIWIWRGRK